MFAQVHIIQCKSSGEFLTRLGNFTRLVSMAGLFLDKRAATDTALNELDADFVIFSYFTREADLPAYLAPHSNTGDTEIFHKSGGAY